MIFAGSNHVHFRALRQSLALLAILAAPCQAMELQDRDGIKMEWDNTLRYSIGARLGGGNPQTLSYPNSDDGDRAFAPGLISSRFDLLSVLDVTGDNFGAQLSIAAWYDSVYHSRNDTPAAAATVNAVSVPPGRFVRATRDIDGQYAELSDSFVYGNFNLGDLPVLLRFGRQKLLWGESLFFPENGIAAGQAPVDYVRSATALGGYSRDAFLPVDQLSLNLQPAADLSLAAYYQLGWRASRLPGVGSYFSISDLEGAGAERGLLQAGNTIVHGPDRPPGGAQFGVSLHKLFDDLDIGLYALQFDAKYPMQQIRDVGGLPQFYSGYADGIALYGASFSTYLDASTLAGEISLRQDMPLVSTAPISLYAAAPLRSAGYGYARGDTLHGQISLVETLSRWALWDSADVSLEIAANDLLAVTYDAASLQDGRDRFAASARALLQPHYFAVLPNVDVTPLLGLGIDFAGRSSVDYNQNAGAGDFEAGISATYLSVWKLDLTYTGYFGSPTRQPLEDRGFLMLGLERTF